MLKKIKYVILEAPYENIELESVQEYFPKLVRLKKSGYSSSYRLGALPFDTTDFVGTHHYLLIQEADKTWDIALGYKTISLARCDLYGLSFPALTVTETSNAKDQAEYVRSVIADCRSKKLNLVYGGCWTSKPSHRKDRELNTTLRDLMSAMLFAYHRHEDFQHRICFGVPRFKTDAYFCRIGYEPAQLGGKLEFPQKSLLGEPVKLLHSFSDTEFGLSLYEKYLSYWQEREVVGINPETLTNRDTKEAA